MRARLALVLACALEAPPAHAFDIKRTSAGFGQGTVIELSGTIRSGDFQSLTEFIRGLDPADRLVRFSLNSGGGDILEAAKIAEAINKSGIPVFVDGNALCASACFLLFAAGKTKSVEAGAKVGVHSASINSQEGMESMAVTVALAREARTYGVPHQIIGKLVATPPDQVLWLTEVELLAMGATIRVPEQTLRRDSPNLASTPAVMPPPPRAEAPQDWARTLAGRWRFSDGRACARGYGTASVENGAIRFEWRMPDGRVNVAVERIDSIFGNTVNTTVVSDVGTPTPEVGHRLQYEFGVDQWTSVSLTTRARGRHTRC